MRKLCLWLGIAGYSCLLLLSASVIAADLRIHPTSLIVAADRQDAEISFSNLGDRPLRAKVRLYRWTQQQGQDKLSPAQDLAVSPPLMDIPPHGQSIVRVIRLKATPEPVETSYRIVVDELPGAPEDQGKTPLLRYTAPVFLAPESSFLPAHSLTARVSQQGDRSWLRIDNQAPAMRAWPIWPM